MKTTDITGAIKELTKAIECLDTAQLYPMEVRTRMEIGREIRCLYALINEITMSSLKEGKE